MNSAIFVIHWIAAVIVLAEALNKLERTTPTAPGLTARQRVIDSLKAVAWTLMAIAAGGALATPILGDLGLHAATSQVIVHSSPSVAETAMLLGFAVLIIRTRIKEG